MSDSDCSKDEFDEEEIEALERERQRIQAQLEDNDFSSESDSSADDMSLCTTEEEESVGVKDEDSSVKASETKEGASVVLDDDGPPLPKCPRICESSSSVRDEMINIKAEANEESSQRKEPREGEDAADQPGDSKHGMKRVLVHRMTDAMERLPEGWIQNGADSGFPRVNADEVADYVKDRFPMKWIKKFPSFFERKRSQRQKAANSTAANDKMAPAIAFLNNSGVRLITLPGREGGFKTRRCVTLNPIGKTSVTVLHEYVQKVIKGIVAYEYTEQRSSLNPYSCLCYLNTTTKVANEGSKDGDPADKRNGPPVGVSSSLPIGKGEGNSKKIAKLYAAKEALKALVPGLNIDEAGIVQGEKVSNGVDPYEPFDHLPIEHDKVTELSLKVGQPTPLHLLQEWLRRDSSWNEGMSPVWTSLRLAHQKHELTLKIPHLNIQTSVTCSNKRDGRHRASQKMLQLSHPHFSSWGAILRVYGPASLEDHIQTRKTKEALVKLSALPSTEYLPNKAVITRLKEELQRASSALARASVPFRGSGLIQSSPPCYDEIQKVASPTAVVKEEEEAVEEVRRVGIDLSNE